MVFAFKFAAALSLLTAALASPVLEARSCKPSFEGLPITIYKTVKGDLYEWTPVNAVGGHITLVKTTAFTNGEFFVESTGLSDNTYYLKLTADTAHSLQLAGAPDGDLSFAPITWSGTSQNFAIDCSSCSTSADVGLNCVISHPATSTCVTSNTGSFTLALAPCDGTFGQQFNFRA